MFCTIAPRLLVEQELPSIPEHMRLLVEQELHTLPEHMSLLVEQELPTIPEHMSLSPVFSVVRVAHFLLFYFLCTCL